MMATSVVEAQANVCQERMGRLGDRIDVVASDVSTVKIDLEGLTETVEKGTTMQREQMTDLLVAVTRNNTRWSFFRVLSAIASALGAVAGIAALIVSLINRP